MIQRILRYLLVAVCLVFFVKTTLPLYQTVTEQRLYIQKLEAQQFKTNLGVLSLAREADDRSIEISSNFETISDTIGSMQRTSNNITTAINNINATTGILIKRTDEQVVSDKIRKEIKKDKVDQFILEKKLQMVNVYIENSWKDEETQKVVGCIGSGVTLKYKGQFYVLTAAHLLEDGHENLMLKENGNEICPLRIIKVDKEQDLMLLSPVDPEITPMFYTELADEEPQTAQQVYVVGNPAGMEDQVCEGRVLQYDGNYMIVKAIDTFFGNSGGGIYTRDGKLVGIVSAAGAIEGNPQFPPYILDFEIRLDVIKIFLKDVN